MSFGRLLAAGRSMMGGGQWGGRYQMRKGAQLPRFISPRNPFAREDAQATPSPRPDGEVGETVNEPLLTATATSAPVTNNAPLQPNLALLIAGRVVRGLWASLKKLKREKRPAIPVFGKPTVQGELTLSATRTSRNNFADVDVNNVPNGGGSGPMSGPQTSLLNAQPAGAK